jgi:AcrR family transcriptional regulator
VDDRIVAASLELLRARGPAAVTVESVAARSGVARTTIYRRYRDRAAVLRAAMDRLTDQEVPPEDLDVRDKLRWVLTRVCVVLEEGLGRGGVGAVLTDGAPELTDAFREALAVHLRPLEAAIAADAQRGLLRPDLDADVVVNLVFGSYLGEVLRYGRPRGDWMDRTLDHLVAALSPPPGGRRRARSSVSTRRST